MRQTFIATTIMGLEATLAREIKALGIETTRNFDTRVEFDGDLVDLCKANLWLRTAGRVFVKIAEFDAFTFDELFDQTADQEWEKWIPADGKFPIANVTSRKSELFSKSTCQSVVKKAIVERLKKAHKCHHLPETGANFPVRIQIDKNKVILSIDSSGEGLNKRGYRALMDKAPLRETLAAGLVLLSRYRADKDVLMDPLCGTATILIEAGLIAKNIAPGLNRSFNAEQWKIIPSKCWQTARTEAKDSIIKENNFTILGSDKSYKAISTAKYNIERAGLSNINIQKLDVKDVSSKHSYGKIITNPPYGERLDTRDEAEMLYEDMGDIFSEKFPDWHYYILTANEHFEDCFGCESTKHRKLYNGGLKCMYYQYF